MADSANQLIQGFRSYVTDDFLVEILIILEYNSK